MPSGLSLLQRSFVGPLEPLWQVRCGICYQERRRAPENFGVLYSPSSSPRLSPVYDMLTMGAYAPRANNGDALDGMALTLRGTRRWPRQADLDALAELCGVSPEEKEKWYRHLQEAIGCVSLSVLEFCRSANYDSATSRLARMLELWSFGCTSNSPPATAVARNAALALRTQR